MQKENTKLKNELKKNKGYQKVLDALRMNRKEQSKHYQIEGSGLDYLRPRDFEDDKIKNENTYVRAKRPQKNYAFKKTNKKDDNKDEDKNKAERAALAIMRIVNAQEKKRKNEE